MSIFSTRLKLGRAETVKLFCMIIAILSTWVVISGDQDPSEQAKREGTKRDKIQALATGRDW